jgi:hypothetical protein
MTRAQSTVIWLGLVLVALNIVVHINDVKALIFGGTAASGTPTPANTPAGNSVIPSHPSPSPQPTPEPNQVPLAPPDVTVV